MIRLQGKNLCERQKELNMKVLEAYKNKIDFQEVTCTPEKSDVDRLFKIDLASKYKNIDYIIEQLQCGDSLYISRALKCEWIYDNEHAHIINPDYLHNNVFIKMSSKMKRKTLSTISIHVRDETRAQLFCEYCKNQNMTKIAHKFLVFTSESFKQDFITDKVNFFDIQYEHIIFSVIGNSFLLADTYGKMGGLIKRIYYLYSMNEEEFLNLYEKYTTPLHYVPSVKVGAKMSRSILKEHKIRILKDPPLYLSMLKTSEVLKYSSSDDAKVYIMAMLPKDADEFWRSCYEYKDILDLIKVDKIKFLKKIFTDAYPTEDFEMSKEFYNFQRYYDLMNADEKESWALMHLKKQLGIVPEHENYSWYEFIRFPTAFEKIKEEIFVTSDLYKRSELLNILVRSAKTNKEIEQLMKYVYEIKLSEKEDRLQNFIEQVIKHHKVFDFDEACWNAFDKLLHSLGLYDSISGHNRFLNISIVYHIITEKKIPFDLTDYMGQMFFYCVCNVTKLDFTFKELGNERKKKVYDFVLNFYVSKIEAYTSHDYNESVKNEVQPHLKKICLLKYAFKNKDDYPNVVQKFMNLDYDIFKHDLGYKEYVVTESYYLIRCLKQDPTVIIDQFTLIEKEVQKSDDVRINRTFLNKMKIYFSNDLARQYLEMCTKSLYKMRPYEGYYKPKQRLIRAHVFAIFIVGNERLKTDFMDEHAPTQKKPNLNKINDRVLCTQKAICRFHCYSRPPVPIAKTRQYLKGDYAPMCREIFNMYLSNLPPTLLTRFIKLLLIIPSFAQNQGVWLAFQISQTNHKKNLVSIVWPKIKNATLRKNLYKIIVDKLEKETVTGEHQAELFQVLTELTLHVNEDDDNQVFTCFKGHKIPEHLRGSFLQTAWETVFDLSTYDPKIIRGKTLVMNAMKSNMTLMNEVFVRSLVNDYFENRFFFLKYGTKVESDPVMIKFNNATWTFVLEYIVNIPNDEKKEKSINLLKEITQECFKHWNEKKSNEEYCYQLFFNDFVNELHENTSCSKAKYSNATYIFEYLLKSFEKRFGITEMYSYFWDWQLLLLIRKVIDGRDQCEKEVHVRFGSEIGTFVKKLKEQNCYYTSFIRKIVGKVLKFTDILSNLKSPPLTDRYVKILVAYGLTLHGIFETYVLALEILPQDLSVCPVNETELQEVIKGIRAQNNNELTALMNDKFIYSYLEEKKKKV